MTYKSYTATYYWNPSRRCYEGFFDTPSGLATIEGDNLTELKINFQNIVDAILSPVYYEWREEAERNAWKEGWFKSSWE